MAGPYCSMLLADAGARVIKIERPGGDFARKYDRGAGGESSIFAWLNRGKESICLDIKDPNDASILRRMLERADVMLCNLLPGALERHGFAAEGLRERNPGLISCAITGYGDSGEAAKRKAYDFLIQGESGLCAVTGTEDSPARVGVSITDLSTGLTALSAILRALLQRGRTGKGIDLSISMFDVIADWMNMPLMGHRHMGGYPGRTGLTHSFIAPYGAFVSGDGRQILLSIQSNREWAGFCERVLERPDLIRDPRFVDNADRFENREELSGIINAAFSRHGAESLAGLLDAAGIANSRLNSVEELSEHRLLRNLDISIGASAVRVADLPVRTDAGRKLEAPLLDAHGESLRREFGPGGSVE